MKYCASLLMLLYLLGAGKISLQSGDHCRSYKNTIAVLGANVTKCFLRFTSPFRMCVQCEKQKGALKTALEWRNSSITQCKAELMRNGPGDVAKNVTDNLISLWNYSNCDNCFIKNGSGVVTANYFRLLNLTTTLLACLNNYSHADLDLLDPDFELSNWTQTEFNSSGCSVCVKQYRAFNKFYVHLEAAAGNMHDLWHGVCGDLAGITNTTRYLWWSLFRCNSNAPTGSPFLLALPLLLVTALSILYYCLASTFFHNKISWILYRQRRLRPLSEMQMPHTMLRTISQG